MKKLVSKILLFCTSCIICSNYITLNASDSDIIKTKLNVSYQKEYDIKPTLYKSNSHVLTKLPKQLNNIEPKSNVSENILSVDDYFNMFPEAVRNVFVNDGWIYEKIDTSLGKMFYEDGRSVLGITRRADKHIFIDKRDIANKSILHEVGHAFEYSPYVKGANSTEFLSLYNTHWIEWYNNYGMNINNYNTPEEGYAQCWEIYILQPECLDADTRAFIESEIYGIGG